MILCQALKSKAVQNGAMREGERKENIDGKYANVTFCECDPNDGETNANC
jgi:hypothetical protein